MFIAGATLFASGTLRNTAANPTVLIAGHIIQAAGADALSPAALSLLLRTLPGPARARARSIWGRRLRARRSHRHLSWRRSRRHLPLVVGLPGHRARLGRGLLLARQVLEEGARGTRRRFDWRGAATITGAARGEVAVVGEC